MQRHAPHSTGFDGDFHRRELSRDWEGLLIDNFNGSARSLLGFDL